RTSLSSRSMSAIGVPAQPVDATLYLKAKRWSVTMDQGFRRGFTAAEKTELWDRWQRGESLKAIGRAFGKPSSSIYFQVSPYGGIRPAPRRCLLVALTLSESEVQARRPREKLSAHMKANEKPLLWFATEDRGNCGISPRFQRGDGLP